MPSLKPNLMLSWAASDDTWRKTRRDVWNYSLAIITDNAYWSDSAYAIRDAGHLITYNITTRATYSATSRATEIIE